MDNTAQVARSAAVAAWINLALGLALGLLLHTVDRSVPVLLLPMLFWCARKAAVAWQKKNENIIFGVQA